MDALYDMLFDLFGDGSLKVLALIVFVATAATAFGVMALVHSRGAVKRRAAGINHNSGELGESNNSLRRSSLKAVQRVLDYTSKHYEAGDKGDGKDVLSHVHRRPMMSSSSTMSILSARPHALRQPNTDEHQCGSSARSLSRLQAGHTANIFQK